MVLRATQHSKQNMAKKWMESPENQWRISHIHGVAQAAPNKSRASAQHSLLCMHNKIDTPAESTSYIFYNNNDPWGIKTQCGRLVHCSPAGDTRFCMSQSQRERKQDKQTKIGRRVTKVQNCISLSACDGNTLTQQTDFFALDALSVFFECMVLGAAEAENSDGESLSAGDKWYWCAAADELMVLMLLRIISDREELGDWNSAWAMGAVIGEIARTKLPLTEFRFCNDSLCKKILIRFEAQRQHF